MRFRYSLLSLVLCTTAICILGAIFVCTQAGYRAHRAFSVWKGKSFGTQVKYEYQTDALGLRDPILTYVVIVIFPDGTNPPTINIQRGTPVLEDGDRVIEVPNTGQLYEYDRGQLNDFREKVTYLEWMEFVSEQTGPFRMEDLLKFAAERRLAEKVPQDATK
jgi:hypothetical protein